MEPGFEGILQTVALFAVVIIPALAMSARLAVRPMVDALERLHEIFTSQHRPPEHLHGIESQAVFQRLASIERELAAIRSAVPDSTLISSGPAESTDVRTTDT